MSAVRELAVDGAGVSVMTSGGTLNPTPNSKTATNLNRQTATNPAATAPTRTATTPRTPGTTGAPRHL
ncbi:MAG: hypothetical protein ACR2I1_08655 [Propionibacteriaceae bacterium]